MSLDPRDKRTRSSVTIQTGDVTLLVDTATELRVQALREGLASIDAVLMTHAHADHTGGFDDLRRFNELEQKHLPVYANTVTAKMLRERYAYAFQDAFPFYGGKPDLLLHEVDGPFEAAGAHVTPVPVLHGRLPILGYRVENLAYVTDAKSIPDSSLDLLDGVEYLVLNALRPADHPTHLSIPEALALIERIKPRHAWLTHLSHEVSHAATDATLPDHVSLAWDGLKIDTGSPD